MKSFPLFLRTTGRQVTIVGGGEQAAQKARLVLKTDAAILIVADALDPELEALVFEGRARWERALSCQVFEDAAFAFVATGCPALDTCAQALARAARCPVNVVDQPDLCDVTTPAIVDRDPVVVAIGSEGTAPVLTREIKTRLEEMLPQNLGGLAALAGRLRPMVTARVTRAKRRALWAWVFKGAPRVDWTQGRERDAAKAIKDAIVAGEAPSEECGSVSLVGAGPGARDLLTLRAVERLQEADVIFYDRFVDPGVLELARRDAHRVFIGPQVGAHTWPQDEIDKRVLREAVRGKRVVCLTFGDPDASGQTERLRAHNIALEVVPGVVAECAMPVAMEA
ncbi:MAG: SAM-dependent methyltransferase [Paracoccaceae bacterium]